MQKAYDNKEPINSFIVEVTPEQLRNIANRLEYKSSIANQGQDIIMEFTHGIMLLTKVDKIKR